MRLIDANEMLLNDEIEYTEAISETDDAVEIRDFTAKTLIESVHEHIQTLIQEAPTVDAVPVKYGRWLDNYWEQVQCSCCGVSYKDKLFSMLCEVMDFVHYCPSCGAKIEGGAKNA